MTSRSGIRFPKLILEVQNNIIDSPNPGRHSRDGGSPNSFATANDSFDGNGNGSESDDEDGVQHEPIPGGSNSQQREAARFPGLQLVILHQQDEIVGKDAMLAEHAVTIDRLRLERDQATTAKDEALAKAKKRAGDVRKLVEKKSALQKSLLEEKGRNALIKLCAESLHR